MRRFIRGRPSIITGGLLVVLAACSDSGAISAPDDAGAARGQTAAAAGDTARTGAPFTPATSIDLAVTVGAAQSGQDTLAYTPLSGAAVTVYERKLVATPGAGADTLTVSERVVATATTDASGKARFAGLPAAQYRVEAVRAGNGGSASVTLAPPYAAEVGVLLIIRP
jgi:Prealbumin-like fold domain